jgi:hypothetical protein
MQLTVLIDPAELWDMPRAPHVTAALAGQLLADSAN